LSSRRGAATRRGCSGSACRQLDVLLQLLQIREQPELRRQAPPHLVARQVPIVTSAASQTERVSVNPHKGGWSACQQLPCCSHSFVIPVSSPIDVGIAPVTPSRRRSLRAAIPHRISIVWRASCKLAVASLHGRCAHSQIVHPGAYEPPASFKEAHSREGRRCAQFGAGGRSGQAGLVDAVSLQRRAVGEARRVAYKQQHQPETRPHHRARHVAEARQVAAAAGSEPAPQPPTAPSKPTPKLIQQTPRQRNQGECAAGAVSFAPSPLRPFTRRTWRPNT